jgi:adenosine deaminase
MARRIGILVVHGIGTQSRFEHLANVARNFVSGARLVYGEDKVSVEQPAVREASFRRIAAGEANPAESSGEVAERPRLTVLIRAGSDEIAIDFREMWWHDLGTIPTLGSVFTFWLWVISLAGTHGYFEQSRPRSPLRAPANKSTEKGGVAFSTRFSVFWWTNLFFLLLLPARLLIRLVAFIPGLGRIDVFRTVFAYMSSVQMYQERERKHGGALTDFDQSRRASIQRRFANHLVDMAVEKHDSWYILGHSLGSVIAFKGLMSPGSALARYMSINRWDSRGLQEFKSTAENETRYADEPKCPHWMDRDAFLDRRLLFERLQGFITYGSPLEIFAHLWPAIVQINDQNVFSKEFEWLNFYDPTDIVARRAPLSFRGSESISPTDFGCASSRRVWQAHTRYFHMAGEHKSSSLPALVEWMVGRAGADAPPRSFPEVAEGRDLLPLTPRQIKWRRRLAQAELFGLVALCLPFWPLVLAYFGRIIDGFVGFLFSAWAPLERSQELPKIGDFLRLDPSALWHHPSLAAQEIMAILLGVSLFVVTLPSLIHYVWDLYLDRESWWKPAGIVGGLATCAAALFTLFLSAGTAGRADLPPTTVLETAESRTAQFLDGIRSRPPLLRAFLHDMPKGGDIHTHLSGAVYAEIFIAWAAEHGLCIEAGTLKAINPPCSETAPPAADALRDAAYYSRLVDAWSTRNLAEGAVSGHDQFFDAFGKFGEISGRRIGDMLAEVASNAAAQHVDYLEVMLTVAGDRVRALGRGAGWDPDLARLRATLLRGGLVDIVDDAKRQLDEVEAEMRQKLHCGTVPADPGCGVAVRVLQQTSRISSPQEVFAGLLFAVELAHADGRVVGLNLVAPEDHPVALRDYRLHMQMLDMLWRLYPGTNISLHAGELTLGLVPPKDLRWHIRAAVEEGHARRIGHGTALGYEDDAFGLLALLAGERALVEINLTSNDRILGVKGADHPFLDYFNHDVPVALSTDDEGIARSDLTNEYLRATRSYGLGYNELKMLARNSIAYSFLPGPSLWSSTRPPQPVKACASDLPATTSPSADCRAFLDGNPRAQQQWRLESEFADFERRWGNGELASRGAGIDWNQLASARP